MMNQDAGNAYPVIQSTEALKLAIYDYHDWAQEKLGNPLATLNGIYQITALVLECIADQKPFREAIFQTQVLPLIADIEGGIEHVSRLHGKALAQICFEMRTHWGQLDQSPQLFAAVWYAADRFSKRSPDGPDPFRRAYGAVIHQLLQAMSQKYELLKPISFAETASQDSASPQQKWFELRSTGSPSFSVEVLLMKQLISFGRYKAQGLAFDHGANIVSRIEDYFLASEYQGQLCSLHDARTPAQREPETISWIWQTFGRQLLDDISKSRLDDLPKQYGWA